MARQRGKERGWGEIPARGPGTKCYHAIAGPPGKSGRAPPPPMRAWPILLLAPSLPACGAGEAPPPVPPPSLDWPVEPFRLLDQNGQETTEAVLKGRVTVADFFFTSCPSICIEMTRRMQELAFHYRKDPRVQFLSFSVDPARDTPEVLRKYIQDKELRDKYWRFLTGPIQDIRHLSEGSFKLALGEKDIEGEIAHSGRFALIGPGGRILELYDHASDRHMELLRRQIDHLLETLPPAGKQS